MSNVAELSTHLLRTDEGPLWSRLRKLLDERGLDPNSVALADLLPDDTDMEFGIIVTPEGDVYEFDLVYGNGDLEEQAASATIADWRDVTAWWRDAPHRAEIDAALRLLGKEET